MPASHCACLCSTPLRQRRDGFEGRDGFRLGRYGRSAIQAGGGSKGTIGRPLDDGSLRTKRLQQVQALGHLINAARATLQGSMMDWWGKSMMQTANCGGWGDSATQPALGHSGVRFPEPQSPSRREFPHNTLLTSAAQIYAIGSSQRRGVSAELQFFTACAPAQMSHCAPMTAPSIRGRFVWCPESFIPRYPWTLQLSISSVLLLSMLRDP